MRVPTFLIAALAAASVAFPASARTAERGCLDLDAVMASRDRAASQDNAPSPEALDEALNKVKRLGCPTGRRKTIVLVDFDRPSSQPRLWLIDLSSGAGIDQPLHVAHGKGSDPDNTGFAQRFSNIDGSRMTSLGAFQGGRRYWGKHGRSLKLYGRETSNSMAFDRQIVLHTSAGGSANYVSPAWLAANGKLGMSDGCFVVMQSQYQEIESVLVDGGLLIAVASSAETGSGPSLARRIAAIALPPPLDRDIVSSDPALAYDDADDTPVSGRLALGAAR